MKKMDVNKKLILLGLPLLAACMTQPADASSSNRRIYHQINAPHSQARSIQIGSFHSLRNAKLFKTKWRAKINYPIHIKHQGQNYLVIVGPIPPTTERLSNALPDHENVSSVMPPMTRYRNDGLQSFDRREDEYLIPVRPHTSVGQSYHAKNAYHSGWFVGAEAGIMHPRGQSTMLVNSGSDMDPPNNVDRYTVNTSHHNYMGAALGRFWRRDEPALPGIAFGLRYQYIFSHAIDGDVIQYSLSDYNNYRYSWDLSGDVLTAFTKVELIRLGPVMPYVNGGVGVSFNQAGTYNETAAVGIFPRDNPAFAAKSQSALAYDFGLGLDFVLGANLILSAGYDFQNLGEFRSANGQGEDWKGENLNLGRIKTHNALLAITYVADTK